MKKVIFMLVLALAALAASAQKTDTTAVKFVTNRVINKQLTQPDTQFLNVALNYTARLEKTLNTIRLTADAQNDTLYNRNLQDIYMQKLNRLNNELLFECSVLDTVKVFEINGENYLNGELLSLEDARKNINQTVKALKEKWGENVIETSEQAANLREQRRVINDYLKQIENQ